MVLKPKADEELLTTGTPSPNSILQNCRSVIVLLNLYVELPSATRLSKFGLKLVALFSLIKFINGKLIDFVIISRKIDKKSTHEMT